MELSIITSIQDINVTLKNFEKKAQKLFETLNDLSPKRKDKILCSRILGMNMIDNLSKIINQMEKEVNHYIFEYHQLTDLILTNTLHDKEKTLFKEFLDKKDGELFARSIIFY